MSQAFAMLAALIECLACSSRSPVHSDSVGGDGDARGDAEAGIGDATPSRDARAEASSTSWCQTHGPTLFCDDFEEDALPLPWDGLDQQHGQALLDDTAFVSPKKSFLVRTTALEAGAVAAVRVGKSISDILVGVRFGFDMRADALDSSGARVVVCEIQLFDSVGDVAELVDVSLGSNGPSVDDIAPAFDGGSGFTVSHPLSAEVGLGQWTHVGLDVRLSSEAGVATGTLSVTFGDPKVLVVDHVPMGPASRPSVPFFLLGVVNAVGPSEAIAVRFDDVTLLVN